MTKVFTSRLTYDGADKVNTTVQSGSGLGDCLAPTWSLVAGHKLYEAYRQQNQAQIDRWAVDKFSGQPIQLLSDEHYNEQYLDLLRDRYTKDKQPFLDLLQTDRLTLTCYCASGQFCHRHLAVNVLEKVAERHQLPFERGGEIDPYTKRAWVAPDDPRREDIQLGVVPVVTPEVGDQIGYAAVGLLTTPRQLNSIIELAHFHSNSNAEKYLDQVESDLRRQQLPLSGARTDLKATEDFLYQQARNHQLSGHTSLLTHPQNKEWQAGSFSISHTPAEMHFDPDQHEIRFGVLPIVAPDGRASLGLAATALIEQADHKKALLELAHFANNGETRAHEYLDGVEKTLTQTGCQLEGQTHDLEKTVRHLTEEAKVNHVSGEWQPLTEEQAQQLNSRQLTLTHAFDEVHTMSGNNIDIDDL